MEAPAECYLRRIVEAPEKAVRCRCLVIHMIKSGAELTVLMAILSRLTSLTALEVGASVTARQLEILMRVASRDCRIASLSLSHDLSGLGDGGGLEVNFGDGPSAPIQHLAVSDVSASAMAAMGADSIHLRSLWVGSPALDLAAVQAVIEVASRLRELILAHWHASEPLAGWQARQCILANCAPRLVLLSLSGLGGRFLERSFASLTNLVVLDVPWSAVSPSAWLSTTLPRLRVLAVSESDEDADVDAATAEPTVVMAGAIGVGTAWPALRSLYHYRGHHDRALGSDHATAERTTDLLSASLEVRWPRWHR